MKHIPAMAVAALLALVPKVHAADPFIDACMLGASPGTDMPRTCACMSTKIAPDIRADATEALRRAWKAMQDTSTPLDPSTLPPNLMKGLQATVLAQADCM
jgi:hypothetical protein